MYSIHVEQAGVEGLIDEVFSSDLRDAAVREGIAPKLEEIRKKITETPLMDQVVENLEDFLAVYKSDKSATFAVRSSGSAEGTFMVLKYPETHTLLGVF